MVVVSDEVVAAARTVLEHRALDLLERVSSGSPPGLAALASEAALCVDLSRALFMDDVPPVPVHRWRMLRAVAVEHLRELEGADALSGHERALAEACAVVAGAGVMAGQL